ncbi:MAG TPA: CDP-glucose 4,6-dehydratase [Pirellulales bacterium]|jgi:CDP-glucose 4,6-dehydratase|nr:CDP-glucose 4,6-dehydratase [Pirellulales bacterium]
MDSQFWSGRRVFLTGHTGFKGSWLSLWLERMDAQVSGFALDPPPEPSLFRAARVGEAMTDLRGDVRNLSALGSALAEQQPEVVFHLAAQPLVRASYAQPVETFATNVFGTVHLLEAIRHVESVRAVVVVTSDKCYENQEWHWGYRETEPLGGHDPYSASKACAELVTAAWRRSFLSAERRPIGVATARAGNVLGGGDWAEDRIVPDAVRSILAGKPLVVRRPRAIRPWQHVLEPLHGYLMLAERLYAEPQRWSSAWNFGPADNDTVAVGELLDRFFAAWGNGAWQAESTEIGPHEAGLLRLDCSKARSLLGWRMAMDLDDAVAMTADWYRHATAGGSSGQTGARSANQAVATTVDHRQLTLDQIERYERSAGIHAPQRSPSHPATRRAA